MDKWHIFLIILAGAVSIALIGISAHYVPSLCETEQNLRTSKGSLHRCQRQTATLEDEKETLEEEVSECGANLQQMAQQSPKVYGSWESQVFLTWFPQTQQVLVGIGQSDFITVDFSGEPFVLQPFGEQSFHFAFSAEQNAWVVTELTEEGTPGNVVSLPVVMGITVPAPAPISTGPSS